MPCMYIPIVKFQSTRPVRGRDACQRIRFFSCFNFNPRAPCGGATARIAAIIPGAYISIHAPRAGARPVDSAFIMWMAIFQSTRPVRGRDAIPLRIVDRMENFNPRAPCGGATLASVPDDAQGGISIHAPRAGARHKQRARKAWAKLFQSTRPVRGRDQIKQGAARYVDISIHAPRAGARQIGFPVFLSTDTFQSTRPVRGRDIGGAPAPSCFFYFNPRAPCGGATQHNQPNSQPGKFQSTRPVRGRDPMAQAHIKILHISIHAPRAGARQNHLL